MPHVTIEYSANVATVIDVAVLVDAVHDAVLATGVAPPDGLRTRAVAREHYAIADRHPETMFVAVTARLARGRTPEQQQTVLDTLMGVVVEQLGPDVDRTMLSVEYQEIDPDLRINRNDLRARIAARTED